MTVPNFPQSPSDGDSFVSNGITYVWNANGSNEGYWQAQEEDGINAYWSKTGNTLFPTDAADDVEIGGGDIKLKADGSAEFAGGKAVIDDQGNFASNVAGVSGNPLRVFIESDGVASFVGDQGVITLNKLDDLFEVKRPTTNPAESLASYRSNVGGSEIEKISFKADGSAEFAGEVIVGEKTGSTDYLSYSGTNGLEIRNTSTNPVDSPTIRLYGSGGITLSANGSASFSAGVTSIGGCLAREPATNGSPAGYALINCQDKNGTIVARINASGSASFTGAVDAPNVFFNLESDNEANYTVTTEVDEEGNEVETRVYNGPTLDVKEVLLDLQQRVADRDAVIADLTTRIAALEGGSY